jgi:hypothetical protein
MMNDVELVPIEEKFVEDAANLIIKLRDWFLENKVKPAVAAIAMTAMLDSLKKHGIEVTSTELPIN